MWVPLGRLAGDELVRLSYGDVVVQRGLQNKHKSITFMLIHIKNTLPSDSFVLCVCVEVLLIIFKIFTLSSITLYFSPTG